MPAHGEMTHMPWPMGGSAWLVLGLLWVAATIIVALVIVLFASRSGGRMPPPARGAARPAGWSRQPEMKLLMLGLPLELLWEIAQFPLYDVWHESGWGTILYGLAHCTAGDLLIVLIAYELVAAAFRDRRWYLTRALAGGALFTVLGAGYTIYSETVNVHIERTWGYTERMPIVPGLEIGGMPLAQWLLIPPLLVWLMRRVSVARAGA